MSRVYRLINYDRSEVRRFKENRANEYQFNNYIFIDNKNNWGIRLKNRRY